MSAPASTSSRCDCCRRRLDAVDVAPGRVCYTCRDLCTWGACRVTEGAK